MLWRGWCVIWSLLLACSLQAAELVLYTEEGPPLNFSRDGQLDGYAVELVREMERRSGDSVRYELAPWTRGYALAQQEESTGLFSMARIPEREALFQWVGPFLVSQNRFYTHKNSGLRITHLDQAKTLRVALPRGWYSYQFLRGQGFDDIFPVSGADQMVSLFRNGRTDLLAISEIHLPALLAKAGMRSDQLEAQLIFLVHESYLGFSPATDARVVARWQAALDAMKRDGSFATIYQRWFPELPMPERLRQAADTND